MLRPGVEEYAKIRVVGVGGGGSNAVDRMIEAGLMGVEYLAVNTDRQVLDRSAADKKLQIGEQLTRGLGTGGDAALGRQAAEESRQEILMSLDGADMVFITAGMGGGTGTGACPIIAEVSRELEALTVAVVTKPFAVEGKKRSAIADEGIEALKACVDTLIVIPNDRLLTLTDEELSLQAAFGLADTILRQGVQGISELITTPGLINVDFADVKAIMADQGSALMGIGRATGENRAVEAAKAAIASPLLEVSVDGARGILFTVTGGPSMGMHEVSEAAKVITASADPNAKVIFGAILNEGMKDEIKVTVIATGFEDRKEAKTASSVVASGVFTPSSFVKAKASAAVSAESPKSAPALKTAKKQEDGEDLEIPAFIRKKMLS